MADVINIYITDVFLGGRFLRYGTQVMSYYSHSPSLRRDLPNPMCTVFPTVTRLLIIRSIHYPNFINHLLLLVALSIALARLPVSKSLTASVFFHSTLSTKRFTFYSGSGSSSSLALRRCI